MLKPRLIAFWREWRMLILFLVVMVLFRSAIADWNQVPSGSMEPTILIGDRVVVNKLAYGLRVPFTTWHIADWSGPKRGEIVTFYSPEDGKLLIKRVIGVPGDVVMMRDNLLYINGKPATYTHLSDKVADQLNEAQRNTHEFRTENYGRMSHAVMLLPGLANRINSFAPVKIPKNKYLMLGDNRDDSKDSRFIGLIDRDAITGRANTVAFSYNHYYIPRMDRFFHPLK